MAEKQPRVVILLLPQIVAVITVAAKCWTLIATSGSPLVAPSLADSLIAVAVVVAADAVLIKVAELTVDLVAVAAAADFCHAAVAATDAIPVAEPTLVAALTLVAAVDAVC